MLGDMVVGSKPSGCLRIRLPSRVWRFLASSQHPLDIFTTSNSLGFHEREHLNIRLDFGIDIIATIFNLRIPQTSPSHAIARAATDLYGFPSVNLLAAIFSAPRLIISDCLVTHNS